MKKKIVFLTGAGISAESGIRTFRDPDAGLSFPCRFINAKATVGVPMVLDQLKLTFGLKE